MDAKITKKRLNILLSYDWIKIILLAVAAILVWSLIFTMTATRVTPDVYKRQLPERARSRLYF